MRISDWSSDVCSSDLLDLWGLTGVAEWSVSPDVSVKSITGYRRTESHFMRDDDTPFRLLELQTDQTARQFSQELQFSRSEERRVGNGCVRTYRSRWWPDH